MLQADHRYDLKLEFADGDGDPEIHLAWKSSSQAKQIVPASRLFAPAPAPSPAPGVDLIRKPGSKHSEPLAAADSLPVGSVIDARKGTVQLAAEGAQDKPQSVEAWGAVFALAQKRTGSRIVTLKLKPTRGCGRRAQSSKRRPNRLWAHAHGRFRTRGHGSSATVRGTSQVAQRTTVKSLPLSIDW